MGQDNRPRDNRKTTPPVRLPRVTDDDIATCRSGQALIRALAMLGRIDAGGEGVICPTCNKTVAVGKKFKIRDDGSWVHYGSGMCRGGKGASIDLLVAEPLELSFPDAVRALVGKPTSVPVTVPDELPSIDTARFVNECDPEVYEGVLHYARNAFDGEGAAAAKKFYGQWHIAPEVVERYGAVYITRPDHLQAALLSRFGPARLIACGLFTEREGKDPRCLISDKWPVVEPGKDADGVVRNLQFRASNKQYARYLAHKAGKLPYDGNQKFVNLRGVRPENYVGCGLDQVVKAPAGADLFVVEGFKDMMSAATMGSLPYGIPGTAFRPGPAVLDVLREYNVVLSLDGDQGGYEGVHGVHRTEEDGTTTLVTPGLRHYFSDHDIATHVHLLTGGRDVTDRLVEKHAASGCDCRTCTRVRTTAA